MLYHMLFWGVNRCDGSIVTKSARDVHVENFVMRRGNFYLEPIHWLQYLFLYCFFYLKKCKFVRNRKKCNSDKYLGHFTKHHDLITLTNHRVHAFKRVCSAAQGCVANNSYAPTTYLCSEVIFASISTTQQSYPQALWIKLSTVFRELSTGYPQFFAALQSVSCTITPRTPFEVHVFGRFCAE